MKQKKHIEQTSSRFAFFLGEMVWSMAPLLKEKCDKKDKGEKKEKSEKKKPQVFEKKKLRWKVGSGEGCGVVKWNNFL